MKLVLARLELCSCGTVASIDSAGGGAFGSREPKTGDPYPPAPMYLARWLAQDSDAGRAAVLREAKDELESIRRRVAPVVEGETLDQRNGRIRDLMNSGWDAGDVAREVRCGVTDVRNAMKEAERVGLDERVRDLRSRGLSQRQIAMIAETSQATVHRILGR